MPAIVRRRLERVQDVLVEEVGKWSVTDVVEETGDPQRFHDKALGWHRLAGGEERRPE